MASIHSSKLSATHQDISLGYCNDHARTNEAFCEICRTLICANCIMFGAHQGHSVLNPDTACQTIKSAMSRSMKQGKLQSSYSNRFLLDIRDAKLKVESHQSQVISQVGQTFKSLVNSLKKRKVEIEDAVFSHYSENGAKIEASEKKWLENKELGKNILEYSNNPDDEVLLQNSLYIFQSIERLNEAPENVELSLINSVDLTSEISQKEVGFADLIRKLEKIGKFGDEKSIQFRN